MRRYLGAALAALLSLVPIVSGIERAAASDDAHISEIRVQPQAGLLQIIVRADAPIAFVLGAGDPRTIVVKLTNGLLPASFPNFQTIPDQVVQSLTAQQTSLAPASALLAIAVRAQVAVSTDQLEGGKILAININTNPSAGQTKPQTSIPPSLPLPPGVAASAGPVVVTAATLAPLSRSVASAAQIVRPATRGSSAITLRETGVALRDALLDIADAAGTTMIVGDDVGGRVTYDLQGASLDRALHTLLDPRGIIWRRVGASVVIGHPGRVRGIAAAHPRHEGAAFPLSNIDARSVTGALRALFPSASFTASGGSNAVIVSATPADLVTIRTLISGLDVQPATRRTGEAVPLRYVRAREVLAIVRGVYPHVQIKLGPNNTVVIAARAIELSQIKNLIASLDAPPVPAPGGTNATEVVRLLRNSALNVARAIGPAFPKVRFSTTGYTLVISGGADDVARAKVIAQAADLAPASQSTSQLYKIRYALASDIAGVLRKTFRYANITDDAPTNTVVVQATEALQAQIAAAIVSLDTAPQIGGGGGSVATAVVQLQNAVPAIGTGGSTTANDIANSLTLVLGPSYPDLRVTVPGNTTLLAISGSAATIHAARELLAQIDVPATQVTLDTAVYEVSETAARDIGLQIPGAVLSSTIGENSINAVNGQLPFRLQGLGRTPLNFQAQINFLISNGNARVLANPRVTTISGRTATIRAGDNIPFVQNVSGGITGVVTQSVLTFTTGVTLDITPIANPNGHVSVTLHPVVNSEVETAQSTQGVAPPRISSREAQTTVNLNDNDTVVIGGLIQETTSVTQQRVPGLSNIPLLGGLFKSNKSDVDRTELIIVVTPHVILPGHSPSEIQKPPVLPTPRMAPIIVPSPTPAR